MKNILLYVLIFILFLLVGFLYLDRYSTITTSIEKNVATISNKNKIFPPTTPKYSVSIVKAPYIINDGFSFEINIKNISITPFMTKIWFTDCKFTDNKGKEYKGNIMTWPSHNTEFSKALFPSESKTIELNKIEVSLQGVGYVSVRSEEGKPLSRCDYNNNGDKICVPIEGVKFKECTAMTSTGINYSDKFPLMVNFPQ